MNAGSTLAGAMAVAEWDDIFDAEDAKEVFYPCDPNGEFSAAIRLKFRFEAAGYQVTTAKKPSRHHPVWLVKIIRQSAPQFPDEPQLLAHVRQILRLAEFRLPKSAVTAQRNGKRILVCFVEPSPSECRPNARLRRLLAELP